MFRRLCTHLALVLLFLGLQIFSTYIKTFKTERVLRYQQGGDCHFPWRTCRSVGCEVELKAKNPVASHLFIFAGLLRTYRTAWPQNVEFLELNKTPMLRDIDVFVHTNTSETYSKKDMETGRLADMLAAESGFESKKVNEVHAELCASFATTNFRGVTNIDICPSSDLTLLRSWKSKPWPGFHQKVRDTILKLQENGMLDQYESVTALRPDVILHNSNDSNNDGYGLRRLQNQQDTLYILTGSRKRTRSVSWYDYDYGMFAFGRNCIRVLHDAELPSSWEGCQNDDRFLPPNILPFVREVQGELSVEQFCSIDDPGDIVSLLFRSRKRNCTVKHTMTSAGFQGRILRGTKSLSYAREAGYHKQSDPCVGRHVK